MGVYGSPELYPFDNKPEPEVITPHGKLLGFRSGKLWKKIISVLYLGFLALLAISVIFGKNTQLTGYDLIVNDLQSLVVILFLGVTLHIFVGLQIQRKLPIF